MNETCSSDQPQENMALPTAPHIDPRRLVRVNPERATDVSSTDFPGHYPGEENEHSWNLDTFKRVRSI